MNYLLLMYHTESYWSDQTEDRDQEEEAAFTEFCNWMRENGISWDAMALDPSSTNLSRTFRAHEATSQLLPEVVDVITGVFLLTIPDDILARDVLDRCPHIQGTKLEIRKIAE